MCISHWLRTYETDSQKCGAPHEVHSTPSGRSLNSSVDLKTRTNTNRKLEICEEIQGHDVCVLVTRNSNTRSCTGDLSEPLIKHVALDGYASMIWPFFSVRMTDLDNVSSQNPHLIPNKRLRTRSLCVTFKLFCRPRKSRPTRNPSSIAAFSFTFTRRTASAQCPLHHPKADPCCCWQNSSLRGSRQ